MVSPYWNVFVTLQKGMLKNRPSISGSFAYGETLTVDYTKQDDEMVRGISVMIGSIFFLVS